MEVVDETQYNELEYPNTSYTNVTSLKLLGRLNEFCLGLHTANSVDIT